MATKHPMNAFVVSLGSNARPTSCLSLVEQTGKLVTENVYRFSTQTPCVRSLAQVGWAMRGLGNGFTIRAVLPSSSASSAAWLSSSLSRASNRFISISLPLTAASRNSEPKSTGPSSASSSLSSSVNVTPLGFQRTELLQRFIFCLS